MRTEIRFAGVGGQGSVLASSVLAEAAGVLAGLEAVQTQFYEAAIRDGAADGDVVEGAELDITHGVFSGVPGAARGRRAPAWVRVSGQPSYYRFSL